MIELMARIKVFIISGFLASCVYSMLDVRHIFIDMEENIEVVKTRALTLDEGVPASYKDIDLPTEYVFKGSDYFIYMKVPVVVAGSLYIDLRVVGAATEKKLFLASDQFDFQDESRDWPYTIFLDEHSGDKHLRINVVDQNGLVKDKVKIGFGARGVAKFRVIDAI